MWHVTVSKAQVTVRPVSDEDSSALALVHLEAFPDAALTKLGRGAVERFYHAMFTGPHDVSCFGAERDGQLVGFSVGGVLRSAETYFVGTNRFYLAYAALTRPRLLLDPRIRSRVATGLKLVWRFLRERARETLPETSRYGPAPFSIQSIAVSPRFQNLHVGKALLAKSEEAARERHFALMLLTVHPNNLQAIRFYERNGWTKELVDGTWHSVMTKPLGSAQEQVARWQSTTAS